MKLIAFPLVGVATLAGVVAFTAPGANQIAAMSGWMPMMFITRVRL
jgi:hypothetical protein